MHNYAALSDHDFELLAASLLEAELGGHWETFARGADAGVDVRRRIGKRVDVVQCKHYLDSTFSTLKSAAKKEKKNLDKLKPAPTSYRFWTSKSLSSENKATLKDALKPWIKSEDQIWGREEIETALVKYPDVERGHTKLWIAGAGQLSAQVNGGIWERSRQLAVDIEEGIPRYVETGIFDKALTMLENNRVTILSGPPGVGKTTLARLIVAKKVQDGYEPIEISSDVAEAQQVVDYTQKQVFYYDDFLGSTFLSNRLDKNEDKRLAQFIRSCRNSERTLFVMTTREYILRQAVQEYEELERVGVDLDRLVVKLNDYSRLERARIFYNHVYHSTHVGEKELQDLRRNNAYISIVDHNNYSPRLIEFVTYTDPQLRSGIEGDFAAYVRETFANPARVWKRPFETQLDAICQAIVVHVGTVGLPLREADVEALIRSATEAGMCGPLLPGELAKKLKILDDTFLATTRGGPTGDALMLELQNPSVQDFIATLVVEQAGWRRPLIASSLFFDQVLWLYESVVHRLEGAVLAEFESDISQAVVRCYARPAPELVLDLPWDARTAKWVHSDPVERLRSIVEIMRRSALCRRELEQWFRAKLGAEAALWNADPDSHSIETCSDATKLLTDVYQLFDLPADVLNAVVKMVLSQEPTSLKWELLTTLGNMPVETTDYLSQCRDEFDGWLDGLLDSDLSEVSPNQLEDAHSWADIIGLHVDRERYDELLAHAEEFTREQDYYDDDDDDDRRADDAADDELRAVFER